MLEARAARVMFWLKKMLGLAAARGQLSAIRRAGHKSPPSRVWGEGVFTSAHGSDTDPLREHDGRGLFGVLSAVRFVLVRDSSRREIGPRCCRCVVSGEEVIRMMFSSLFRGKVERQTCRPSSSVQSLPISAREFAMDKLPYDKTTCT